MNEPLYIDVITNKSDFTQTGILWQGTFDQLMTEATAVAKELGISTERFDIAADDPDRLIVFRRVFPEETSND